LVREDPAGASPALAPFDWESLMMFKTLIPGLLLVGAVLGFRQPQEERKPQDADMEKLMAVYEKAAMPGEAHKALASMAGKWDQKGECPMGTITGTVEYRPILGGRFVLAEGTMQVAMSGKPPKEMQSVQIIGYDNVSKQYQTVWLDTMSTGIHFSPGTADASGKQITYDAPAKDAFTPEGRPFKVVVKVDDADKHTVEIWDSKADRRTLTKEATITETRAK
jgi:hypothetical protein